MTDGDDLPFPFQGVLDRFSQIQPRLIFSVEAVRYNGKEFSHMEKLQQVVKGAWLARVGAGRAGAGCRERLNRARQNPGSPHLLVVLRLVGTTSTACVVQRACASSRTPRLGKGGADSIPCLKREDRHLQDSK